MSSTIGNVIRAAKAMGRGKVVSRQGSNERFAPGTAGLGPFDESFYYGLGVLVTNSWAFQNPQISGYTAIMAYMLEKASRVGGVA